MRKEQGRKLKERMQKKREDKIKSMQDELNDLQNLEKSRQLGQLDLQAFREEIQHRGLSSLDDCKKRI